MDYNVSKKLVQLNEYLEEEYPDEAWDITQQEGKQYNPYQFEVKFENEKGWTYTYTVINENKICQVIWTPPKGMVPSVGKHFEGDYNSCD
ncbi:hypothetical protein ACKXGF_13590 [Alkalibacillus sp. S2W]|uniref:hypothetical protein n=1 Tax=Alkalibacillus sp. S2W TaxID=3386553 RepID=UPI00398CC1B1